MSSKNLENLMDVTIEKIKQTVDTDAVIGKPITTPDGTTVIPISRVAYGFGSGGSDFPNKTSNTQELFGGGGGAGVSITPMGFLVISDNNVKMIQIEPFNNTVDRVIADIPVIIDKVSSYIKEAKKAKTEKTKKSEKSKRAKRYTIDEETDEVADNDDIL